MTWRSPLLASAYCQPPSTRGIIQLQHYASHLVVPCRRGWCDDVAQSPAECTADINLLPSTVVYKA
jgi:hypothetical protein